MHSIAVIDFTRKKNSFSSIFFRRCENYGNLLIFFIFDPFHTTSLKTSKEINCFKLI